MREVNKEKIEVIYGNIYSECLKRDFPENMKSMSKDYSEGLWKIYLGLISSYISYIHGKVVLDFGCKYGFELPLFLSAGAKCAIGVDAEPSYVNAGSDLMERLYPEGNAKIYITERGLIPLQPETVDFVFMNEVISHVNQAYLDTVYSEVARVLKKDGIVFISDGNNAANRKVMEALRVLWNQWENGPDGTKTDRGVVNKPYIMRRKEVVAKYIDGISQKEVEFLAENTSGLFGESLLKVLDVYRERKEFIKRPYRQGTVPTNPCESGVLIERAFHPEEVVLALAQYGIKARHLFFIGSSDSDGLLKHLRTNLAIMRLRLMDILRLDRRFAILEGFFVEGKKVY